MKLKLKFDRGPHNTLLLMGLIQCFFRTANESCQLNHYILLYGIKKKKKRNSRKTCSGAEPPTLRFRKTTAPEHVDGEDGCASHKHVASQWSSFKWITTSSQRCRFRCTVLYCVSLQQRFSPLCTIILLPSGRCHVAPVYAFTI